MLLAADDIGIRPRPSVWPKLHLGLFMVYDMHFLFFYYFFLVFFFHFIFIVYLVYDFIINIYTLIRYAQKTGQH